VGKDPANLGEPAQFVDSVQYLFGAFQHPTDNMHRRLVTNTIAWPAKKVTPRQRNSVVDGRVTGAGRVEQAGA